jgi:carboxylesterase
MGELRIAFDEGRGSTAVLLLHGLSGTPGEVEPLGRALSKEHRVLSPWLPGHGTRPEDLKEVVWDDWTCEAEKAFDFLAERAKHVYVGGLSMGACCALHVGLSRPVAGIISMAAPIHIQDLRFRGLAFFQYLQWSTRELTGGVLDPKRYHETYPWCPTKGLYELKKLADSLTSRLGDLKAPLLVLHGRRDSMVPTSNAEYLYGKAGSKSKHLRWMDHSDHVLPLDFDRQKVFRSVGRFIESRGISC